MEQKFLSANNLFKRGCFIIQRKCVTYKFNLLGDTLVIKKDGVPVDPSEFPSIIQTVFYGFSFCSIDPVTRKCFRYSTSDTILLLVMWDAFRKGNWLRMFEQGFTLEVQEPSTSSRKLVVIKFCTMTHNPGEQREFCLT